ncbi:MAG: NADH-quinone oxidoreductase subunit NuoF [Bacillota bacterium]
MSNQYTVTVGLGSCGIAAGAQKVYDALQGSLKDAPVNLAVGGCMGMCFAEPLVEVATTDGKRVIYGRVKPEQAAELVKKHVESGQPVAESVLWSEGLDTQDAKYYNKQERILLKNCGVVDPESIDSYMAFDGYKALEKALKTMTPEQVIKEVEISGLRGRGGGGFPTHIKWTLASKEPGPEKYVICNADEGDPGAFMDRSVLESDPHRVMEGMMLAGYAIGASEGYIYARAEYPLAIKRLRMAIEQANAKGLLGKNILGSGFDFQLYIREGAGAFVCGEETALIMSIEGQRGMPRTRPPFPAVKGLWGKPTNINNVETYANVPFIVFNGGAAFAKYGTDSSKGTKVFALAGKIARGGLIEVPMGITLNEVVFDIGGGLQGGGKLKAVQTGGPSGGCIPAELCDTPIDYDSLRKIGAIMGSGGLLIMDESACMVDVAKFFLHFTQDESCGKCTFCRVGTKQMLEILERITEGKGKEGDIELLEDLATKIVSGSLCGLGQSAPNPVLTTIKYFRHEYEAHINDKICPAKKCKALISYEIDAEKCKSCSKCAKGCPTKAITGAKKEPYVIDKNACIRCGLCISACKFDAVMVTTGTGRGE